MAVFDRGGLLSQDQRQAVEHYNRKLAPLGWLPVTRISEELERAFEKFDAVDIYFLVDAVIENPQSESWPKRKTLVRLLWDNY